MRRIVVEILQLVKNRLNFIRMNNSDFTKKEIEEIHDMGRITYLEKALEWEKGGICAPMECMGEAKAIARCASFSDNCHECLIKFASRSRTYEPFSNDFEFPDMDTEEEQVSWVHETENFRNVYNKKHLARVRKKD